MPLTIPVTDEQITKISTPITRETFDDFLVYIISQCIELHSDIKTTVLTFATSLSKINRYNIHRLNNNGFKTFSFDDNEGNRIMQITLSKEYVQYIFRDYDFSPAVVPPPLIVQPPTDKQVLFSTLMSFIHNNLEEEFQNYLNTI